jgi:hypothetical protein
MRDSSTVLQSVIQRGGGAGIVWHATATQDAQARQSGGASASAGQTDRTNHAGWNGSLLSAGSQSNQASAPAVAAFSSTATTQVSSLVLEDLVVAPRVLGAPVDDLRARAGRAGGTASAGTSQGVLADVHALRSAPRSTGGLLGASERTTAAAPLTQPMQAVLRPLLVAVPAPPIRAGHTAAPTGGAPVPPGDSSFGSGGAGIGAAAAGAFATASAPSKFAAPTSGRPLQLVPVLGRPAETAPLERPG